MGYNSMYDGLEAAKNDPAPPPKPGSLAAPARSILKSSMKKPNATPPASEEGPAAKRAKVDDDGDAEQGGGEGDSGPGGMGLSAAQVANMVCEMYSSKGKMRLEFLSNVFSEGVKTMSLFSCESIAAASGKANILASLEKLGPPSVPAEACARVFIETDRTGGGSFSLDIYAAGRSPGFSGSGVMSAQPPTQDGGREAGGGGGEAEEGTIVLYKVLNDQIDCIWVGEDVGCGMQGAGARETFVASPLWAHCLSIVRAASTGVLTCHYSNYSVEAKDALGLGIGSVSEAETWQEDGAVRPAAVDLGGAGQGEGEGDVHEVEKAVTAFDKVRGHLESDKKFSKAVGLLAQMLTTHLFASTAAAAFLAVKAAMGPEGGRAGNPAFRRDVFDLVNVVLGKRDILAKAGSREAALIDSWRMAAVTSNALLNDDTFEFAKAAKEVTILLQEFGQGPFAEDAEVRDNMASSLVTCLQLLQARYSFAWAKTSVDMCYKVLTDPRKRAAFGKAQAKVEELIDGMNKRKNAAVAKEANDHYQTAGFQHGKKGW